MEQPAGAILCVKVHSFYIYRLRHIAGLSAIRVDKRKEDGHDKASLVRGIIV